ncbi:MAG: 5'-nucleotidase C-terminal domain-containing protein [Proteobacteria bacterium]|nr:5'-nucleotidase C-terminal domain-containing protein [Cystobacterineae bacterium]MCL2315155.1 5'-nucleotidase C-terminal domain-containing protein [Pseudomonadota bacterium]
MRMHVLAALVALVGFSCVRTPLRDTVPKRSLLPEEAIHLVLVATNDWHAQLFATAPDAPGVLPQGGALTFFSMLSALREAFPGRVLWVDGGDMLHGEWATGRQRGQVVVEAFSLMGLDFATLGEGDFGFGPLAPPGVPEEGDAQDALKACLARAKFPWSSANIYSKADGARPTWLGGGEGHMVERQGVHIGFLGITTPTTSRASHAFHLEGLYFGHMALAVEEGVQALRGKGAQLVVLAIHAGGECSEWGKARDLSTCNLAEGELWQLLEALPEGLVDVVVAGHTHKPLGHFFKGVPVLQTRGMGKSFALAHLYWEPTERRLLPERTRLQVEIPICEKVWPSRQHCEGFAEEGEEAVPAVFFGKALKVDSKLEALLEPVAKHSREKAQELLGIEVGERLSLGGEASALGGMWAEGLWLATKADIALISRRAFRADLEAGPLSAGRLYESMPYDNRVALVRFSGKELKWLMQLAFGQTHGGFDLAGAEVELSCSPSGRRLAKVQLLLADGRRRAIEDRAFYWVAMSDFLLAGGDGLEALAVGMPARRVKLGEDMREEVVRFWRQRQKPLLAPQEPRVLNFCEGG